MSLVEFGVLAIEIRRLLESLRPADARDLRPAASAGEAESDPAGLLDAISALVAGIDETSDQLDDGIHDPRLDLQVAAVTRLARIGISNGGAPADVVAATALQPVLQRRLANLVAAKVDAADPQPGLEARLAILLGRRLPLLGRFTIAGAAGGPVVDLAHGPATADQVDDWLDAVGRVRRDVGSLSAVALLSELVGGRGLDLHAGQDPIAPAKAGRPPAGLPAPAACRSSPRAALEGRRPSAAAPAGSSSTSGRSPFRPGTR